MASSRQTYGDLFDMPAGLRKFVLSKEFDDADGILQQTYGLSSTQTIAMGDAIMATIDNTMDVPALIAQLRGTLVPQPIPESKWNDFVTDLIKLELWPLRELFGSELTQFITDQQISTAAWPQFRVLLRPVTYSGAASEVATLAGFTLMSAQQRERLRDLIMSRAKGVRIDAQVNEVLIRPMDFGGLGLDAQTAEKTITAMNQFIAQVQILSEEEYTEWLAEEARKKSEPAVPAPAASDEDPEIANIRATMQTPPVPQTVLDSSITQTLAAITDRPTDPYLLARLQHIISSRFRDVRSAFEVQQLLLRDSKVGGMGFDQVVATRASQQIEQAYRTYHEPIMADEKNKLEQQVELQKTKIDDRRKREAEEHARWYQERIVARKADEANKQVLATQMRAAMSAYNVAPMDAKAERKEAERFGQMVPAVTVGATPVQQKSASVPATAAVPAAGRVARPEVKVSSETVKLQSAQPVQKPRMDDVTFTGGPKLMGLSQELRQLTISEFRRMAKDPESAVQKISQKIETLGQESFEKRIEGIQAWQASPLQEAYVRLVSESFAQGRPVVEVAQQKRDAGVDALHPEEVSAIITLNSKLHY